jgi:hypothetical protein
MHDCSLRDYDQQHQYNNQHDNDRQTPILPRLLRKPIQPAPSPPKLRRMPIYPFLHIIQQHDLPVQLIPNLHAQFSLASDTRTKLVQLVILVAYNLAMVLVNLLIVELGLIGSGIGVWIVAVREQSCAVWIFSVCGVGRGVVAEADGLGGLAGFLLCGGEVGGEGGVVWFRESRGCGGCVAVELGG